MAQTKDAADERPYGPHSVKMADWIDRAPFESRLGMQILEAADGTARLEMPFTRHLAQGFGLMHGGALVSLADTAVVMAIKSLIPPGSRFATTRLEVDYLGPVTRGTVTARARVVGRSGRNLDGECVIFDESERPVLECHCRFRVARDVPEKYLDALAVGTGKPAQDSTS